MATPDAAALARVPLFEGVPPSELEKLASWFEVEEWEAGRRLTVEDRPGYMFYVVAEGHAHAEHEGKTLETLGPGSVFGEMAFFNLNGRRTADVVVDTPVTVYSLFGTRFRELQMNMPEVAVRLEALSAEHAERDQTRDAGE